MLTVWGRRSSFNVQKVLWLVGELDLGHRHIAVGGDFAGLDTAEFRALNPCGRIPVIQDGDVVIWESHAILRYLAAAHGGDDFWSDDAAIRSIRDRWIDWSATTWQPAFMALFWGFFRTPPAQRNAGAVAAALERCRACLVLLDQELRERPFLAGDRFTLADIPAGAALFRYTRLEVDRPATPHVDAWHERLASRPAHAEHVAVPFEELRGRLTY